MGADQWREADKWPPLAQPTSYYLVAPKPGSRHGSLTTEAPEREDAFSSFDSDPAIPVTNPYQTPGAHDYRELAQRSDVLIFDTSPLERDTEVTGPIRVQVYLACDCRDLDLWARLLDVAPDGTAFNLMSPGLDVQRASYRDLQKGRQLLTPRRVYELHLDNLITSNYFHKGHRIRIQISAAFFPNFSRNPQTGDSESVSAKLQKARVLIYSDRRRPSRILLPLVSPKPDPDP
jgi:putative CocE/NonD family hydrolase